jgi:hypothetical protein
VTGSPADLIGVRSSDHRRAAQCRREDARRQQDPDAEARRFLSEQQHLDQLGRHHAQEHGPEDDQRGVGDTEERDHQCGHPP